MRGQKSNTKAGMPRGYYAGRPQMAEPGRYHADRADGHLAKKNKVAELAQRQNERRVSERQKKQRAAQNRYERKLARRRKALRRNRREKARWQQCRVISFSNLLLAFIGFLFIVSFSVVLVLNLRTIYYYDI